MPRPPSDPRCGEHRLLDPEALEVPRRLSRDEHRAVAGPDWVRTRDEFPEEDSNA